MIYIYGASGHGKVILDILAVQQNYSVSFVDDGDKTELLSIPVYNISSIKLSKTDSWIIGVGDNRLREKLATGLDVTFLNAVHPCAVISRFAVLGKGVAVMPGAIINAGVTLGNHVIINTNSSIDHDCVVGDFVHVAPNATLCGGVTIGKGTLIGAGATIIPGISVGNKCVIGAGAVIIEDVPDGVVVVGVPGKIVKR